MISFVPIIIYWIRQKVIILRISPFDIQKMIASKGL